MTERRRIAVLTTTRADYGLLRWIMAALRDDPRADLQVIVSGTHLSPTFGSTVNEIRRDFVIAAEIDMLVDGNGAWAAASSAGLCMVALSNTLRHLQPDLLLILGDRFEILAAAQAAFLGRIPIAHLHGGEVTHGALDDSIRHAITKLSRLHLVSTEEHGRRVRQLGEDPAWVHVVGAPGLENLLHLPPIGKEDFEARINFRLRKPAILMTYHPATAVNEPVDAAVAEILAALKHFPTASIIATGSNADPGGRRVTEVLKAAVPNFSGRLKVSDSLGQDNYLNAMRLCDVVLGNSSSGLLEAPSAGTPTVNLGCRQEGRPRAASVIDAPLESRAIVAAIERALAPEMREISARKENPYASAGLNISRKVADMLVLIPSASFQQPKPFLDVV